MTKKKTTRAVEREYKNRIKKEMSKNFLIVIFILWLILIFSLANTTKTSQVSSSKITGFTIGERPEQQVIKIKKIITEKTEILLSDYNIYNITSLHISGNYKELNKNTIIKIYLTTDLEKYLVYELQQERIDKNNKTISENIITDYIINKTKDEEQTLINNINNKKDNIEETEDNKEEHNININETTNIEKNSVEEEIKEIDFFDDEKTYYFENECLETCKIEAKNGKLVIEIENATLSIDKIIYTTHITRDNKYYPAHNASQLEKEVIQTKKIPDQYTTINQTISINLSEFFYESNLTGLTFDYRKIEYVTTKIDNFSISYTPEKEGIYNTYIYAMNKISIVRSNIFSIIVNNTYYNNNITDINITNVTTKTDTKNDNITINKTTNITINQTNTTINISQINTAYIRNITAIDYDNENLEFLKIKFAYNNIIFKNLTKVTITTIAADNITENTAKEEHTLEIKSEDNSSEVKIEGITKIRNITKIRFFNKTKDERITTDIFAINSIEITNATIKLKTKGHVKNIYKCEEYDFDIEECPNWQITDIPFSEENDTITFTINHFTAYAGGGSGETQANLTVWDSTDTGMPYADMTLYTNESIFIYANYTNFTNEIISGNCIIKYYNNIFNMSFNYTKNIYEYNLHADITYHGIHDFTINCSSTQYTNLSATDSYTIQNYTTTINTTNTTGIILGQKAKFVANYSSEKTGSIGRTIWRGGRTTPTNDIISVAFFDCNGDGKKRCIALGDYALILFNYTFQSISVNPYSEGSVYDIKILDLNKDGRDEIITAKHNGIFVYYSNGSEWWRAYNTTSSPFNYIAYGDINNDSYYELAFGQTYDDRIIVFNYSGVELWNYTKPNVAAHAYRGLVIGNFSNNGKIAYAKHYGGYGIINYTGSEIWSPTNQTSGDINIINLDNDTYDELVVYSDGLRAFDDDGTSLWTIPQIVNANYEIEVTDIDNDGMTEIIYQDGNYILVYNANLTTTLQKWNYTQTSTNNEYFAMAITSKDINDDPIKETMFGGIDNTTFVFDEEGNILYEFYVYGTVGNPNFARPGGRHSAIDVGDVNDDGINDILVGSSDNYAYIFQEANCIIEFNDSTNADMTWNYTTKLWEYERTFDIYQDYSYNVTCSKGGYETQTTTNNEIKVDAAPFFRTLTITPIIAYTNDTLQCIFNITHSEQSTLNITAIWKKDNIDIQNITIIDYEQGTEYTLNLTPKYTYHNNNITCNITASDGRYNITNTTTTQINNYPTTLSINNTNASAGQIIKFTANYSSEKIGDITPFVWNSSDFNQYNNTYTVRFIDLNSDGFANDLIGGGADTSTDDMLIAIYNNGTQAWNLTNLNTFYNIETADLDGDNIINDILVKYEQYVIRRINSNSTTNWSASVTGSSNNHIGIVADIDSDGKKDVVFATAEAGTGGYFLYKGDGTQIWNTTGQCSNAVNFALGDFDRDGKEDDIAFMDWAMCGIGLYLGISVFDNEKNLLFNTTDLGDFNSWPLSVQAIDLNKNGLKDEIIIGYGNTGTMSVFSWNGTYNATYSTTNSIYNNTLNSPITVITAYDYDDDNFSNEFVLGVRDNHIISYNKTTSLWNVSIDRPGIALSLKMGDISDDEKQEIMVGTNTSQFMILSKKGEVIFNYSNGFGKIGANPWGGKSDGIDVGDFNNDGINDVAVSYVQGYFFVYQEVSCIIEFNDSITANMTYNKTSGLWEYSRTFNDGGNYTYNVTCSKGGYETKTNTTQDYVIPNTPPSITEPTINPTIAYTNSTLECSAIAIDNEQTNLNITFFWYKDGVLNTTAIMQTTNNSLTTNSLTQGLQNKNETWNCTVNSYDGLGYSDNKSKSITINNTIPSIPILEYPLNNDTLFTNRTPRFNWTTSIDADNDIINYTIEVSLSSDFSSIIINTTTTNNYYIQTTEFDFATYFWRVRPFDGQNYGEYSNISNFTLVKSTDIILINSTINFGILDNSVIDDTTDNNPYPFILRNNGNSEANITINATQELFITQPLNTSYFQFLVNYSEPNSFDYANSQTTWFNIPNFVYKIIALFNHTDSNDEARIDILINVPSNEPPGDKNTTIIFEASPT